MPQVDIEIKRIGRTGQGVGYDDAGNIYFVRGALPGDIVKVSYEQPHKRYRDADPVELLKPSSQRVDPCCPYFGICGGCDWLHWDYRAQLQAKESMLAHALERANITATNLRPILGSPIIYGYRNRIQVRQDGNRLGFYQKKSHRIVDVETCAVAHPALNQKLAELRGQPPPTETSRKKLELSLKPDGTVDLQENSPHASEGFCQINPLQNQALVRLVAEKVRSLHAGVVLELYCGDGNLTFGYLPFIQQALAIDSNEKSISRALGLKLNRKLSNVEFCHAYIDPLLKDNLPQGFKNQYDTLMVDPPRDGMEGLIESFNHSRLKVIIYISCSPISFSRDFHRLEKLGFVLEEVQPIDMFPHTHHIELLATMCR
ncbi:MAG: class I SAM-dependent RNA methyltransferase [Deltaproteobacteria bacterium]|nr:class I SAM-dependent RNA methyltransferase [Deltaproteobacteria bacterium]